MQLDLLQIIIPLIFIPFLLFAYWRVNLKKLKTYESHLLGKIEVLQKYNKEKVLTINSYVQGVSTEQESIKKSYWYKIAEQSVHFCQKKVKPQVLMLGLGANTIPNLITSLNPAIHQTLIEIDQDIIDACKRFFNLNQLPNYQLIQADAYKLFSHPQTFQQTFDVIIIDIFTGNPPYISLKSNQPHFIEKLLPFLREDGVMIFNRPGHNEQTRLDSFKLKEYLQILFQKVEFFDLKDPRGYRNNVITAQNKTSLS